MMAKEGQEEPIFGTCGSVWFVCVVVGVKLLVEHDGEC